MSVCEWFIAYLLPLFCDVSELPADIVTDVRIIFAFVVTLCAVNLLIWLPYKWITYLLRGGKRRKF